MKKIILTLALVCVTAFAFGQNKLLRPRIEIAEVESEASGAEDEQGVVYDLSGRKLNGQNMRKGIYIVNGKKVFLK